MKYFSLEIDSVYNAKHHISLYDSQTGMVFFAQFKDGTLHALEFENMKEQLLELSKELKVDTPYPVSMIHNYVRIKKLKKIL